MTLQQLRYFCAIVDHRLNVTHAARHLHTSQPGVSRYLQLLEAELGTKLLVRDRKRILALTPIGQTIYAAAKRVQNEIDGVRRAVDEYLNGDVGDLTIAVSHSHARYCLPPVIEQFVSAFPKVRLHLRQGSNAQISQWITSGAAALSISTGPVADSGQLVLLQCDEIHRVVLTKLNHPLARKRRITLQQVASYPIITYEEGFSARSLIMRALQQKGLTPNIILSATDVDTMKTYVRRGLGIAIVANHAHDARQDADLRLIEARHLFDSSPIYLGMRRNTYLPKYMLYFIELFAPHLSLEAVRQAIHGESM